MIQIQQAVCLYGGQPALYFLCPFGGEIIKKIKEKTSVSKSAKEKIQAAPKELLRRGLLTGAEKLQGQLRDASQGGRQEKTEADRAQDATRTITQRATYRLIKLARGKKKTWTRKLEPHADANSSPLDDSVPDLLTEQTTAQDTAEPVRIKTRESVYRSPQIEHGHTDSPRTEPIQFKTRDTYIRP